MRLPQGNFQMQNLRIGKAFMKRLALHWSLIDRTTKLRQKEALVEFKLNLLGAIRVEDKMQEGDKLETAISIGLSCKLLCANTQQIIINGTSEVECRNILAYARDKFGVRSSSG
jgi:phospholipid-transporting ATPase